MIPFLISTGEAGDEGLPKVANYGSSVVQLPSYTDFPRSYPLNRPTVHMADNARSVEKTEKNHAVVPASSVTQVAGGTAGSWGGDGVTSSS